jgi:hypothetical protein
VRPAYLAGRMLQTFDAALVERHVGALQDAQRGAVGLVISTSAIAMPRC